MRTRIIVLGLLAGWSYGVPGWAESGDFLAKKTCPATISIRHAQPDGVQVEAGSSYAASGLNKPKGSYVQVRIPGAKPEQRWVELGCGELRGGVSQPPAAPPSASRPAAGDGGSNKYLLALSWQPAFCETKPDKNECRTETPQRFDADHFTLHGLWPQPQGNAYCGVSARDRSNDEGHRWDALPEPTISQNVHARLEVAMPGIASDLQRHEWIKHGVCYGTDADTYFRTALALLDQVNRSKLRDLMAGHLGDTLAVYQMKQAFEQTFGPGAGNALAVRCSDDRDSHRQMVGEVWINLKGPLTETTALQSVLDTSQPARGTCDRAVVDRVGSN